MDGTSEKLRFSCPACGRHIECGREWAGVALDCPNCGKPIRVPGDAAAEPGPAEAPTGRAAPSIVAPRRPAAPRKQAPAWMAHAGTYSVVAPALAFLFLMLYSLTGGFVRTAVMVTELLLIVSGLLASLLAMVHLFFNRTGLLKALAGTSLNVALFVLLIVPALQRAAERHREIQQEKLSGSPQIHARGMSYMTNTALPRAQRTNAVTILESAASLGYRPSQYSLGYCYMNGIGGPTNRVLAWKWLRLAANKRSPKAPALLQQLRSQMSSAEIAEGERLAEQFVPRPAVPRGTNP